MNFWLLSDTHLGKYNNDSDKWLNLMRSYFFDFFIPTLITNVKSTDKLFFLGDLFDNRTSIDMRAIVLAVEIFEELAKHIECHVLLGNHDQRMMNDPKVNSVASIRNINNVFVYDTETILNFNDHKILLMPWIHGKDTEKDILERNKGCDLLLCHSDLNGCRTQLYPTRPTNRNILDIEDFAGYTKVYSGHIHIVQTIKNFTFVGSPYHLDRNDVSNKKGIWVYNTKKRKDMFIENNFSPEFVKIRIHQETDLLKLKEEIKTNNFIDLELSNLLLINQPKIKIELDKITNKHLIQSIEYLQDVEKEKTKRKSIDISNKSIKDISVEWIDSIKISEDANLFTEIELRNKMKETIDECFNLNLINKK